MADYDTTPDRDDKIIMQIGGKQSAITRKDFIEGYFNDVRPQQDGGGVGVVDGDALGLTASAGSLVALDTIDALKAVASSGLTDGELRFVKAYSAATGQGGGWFRWVADSTKKTDGGVVFVPDDMTVAAAEYTLTYADVATTGSTVVLATPSSNQLAWGTVTISYNDETQTLDDRWLHGHSMQPRHDVNAAVREEGIIDYETATLYGDLNARLQTTILSNTNTNATGSLRTAAVNYSYITGAGRWERVIPTVYVTPAMFGGKSNKDADATRFNNAFSICWALNWLHEQDELNRLHYPGNHYVYGFFGEVYTGILQTGLGSNQPCITYFGEDPDNLNSGGVIDLLQDAMVTGYYGWQGYEAQLASFGSLPYRLMWLHHTCQIHFDEATDMGFEDLCVDGNISENLYFLDNVGGYWDVTPDSGSASANMRETPTYCGFAMSNQAGRYYSADAHFHVRNCTWKNMGGSCLIWAGGGQIKAFGLAAGNSLSGRILYGGQGDIHGLDLFGYTRTSFASPYSGQWVNVTIRDTAVNPWAANAADPSYIVHRGASRIYEVAVASYNTNADERYGGWMFSAQGVNIDMSGLPSNAPFKWSGELADFGHWRVKGPTDDCSLVLRDTGDNGAFSTSTAGPMLHNGQFVNRCFRGVNWLDDSLYGQTTNCILRDITISETFAAANEFTYSHQLDHADWTKSGATVTADQANDEWGNATLDRVIENGASSAHRIQRNFTTTTDKTYVFSMMVRYGAGGRDCYLFTDGGGYAFFDLSAGEFGYVDPRYDDYGFQETDTGLYRIWVKRKEDAGASRGFLFGLADGVASSANATYIGDSASYVDAVGGRLEEFDYLREAIMGPNIIVAGSADPGGQEFTTTPLPAIPASMGLRPKMTAQPTGLVIPQQRVLAENVVDETYKSYFAYVTGGDTASNVPLLLSYQKCKLKPITNKWFRTDLTAGTQNAVNLRIEMVDCEVNTIDPNTAYVGDDTDFRASMAAVVMRGCRTPDGRKSECDELVSVTVVAAAPGAGEVLDTTVNSAGYIDFDLPLMWAPLVYGAYPVSADAYLRGVTGVAVQITGGDYSTPQLRVSVGTVTAGDVLTFRLTGAVCPERTL